MSIFSFSYSLAGTLTGDFVFKKRPPRGALIYFMEDRSLKTETNIDQKNTAFTKTIAVGAKGSTVKFFNSDTINHNIYANDRESQVNFDIGLAPPGSSFEQKITWEEGTMVRISCKIHPKMRAWIASVPSKYHATVTFPRKTKKLSFEITDVPDSISKIKIWMPGYNAIEVDLPKGNSKAVELKRKKKKRGTLTLARN